MVLVQCAVMMRWKRSGGPAGDAGKKKYVINSGVAENQLYSGIDQNELYAEIKPSPNATNTDMLHNNSYQALLSSHTVPATNGTTA